MSQVKNWTRDARRTRTSSRLRRGSPKRFSGRIEQLEARILFAGDVLGADSSREVVQVGSVRPGPDPIFRPIPDSVANPAPDAAAAFARLKDHLESLPLESLDRAGVVSLASPSAAPVSLLPGVYVLHAGIGSFAPPPAPAGWTASLTGIRGVLDSDSSQPTDTGAMFAAGEFNATLVRFQNPEVIDTAVIIGKKILLDNLMLLSDSVTELYIVAETVLSTSDAEIRWEHAGATAEPKPIPASAADGAPDWNPNSPGTHHSGDDGGPGADGFDGAQGEPGLHAPDVHIYVKHFELEQNTTGTEHTHQASLPDITVRGQKGGQGQTGQAGGIGGDGAKGIKAHSTQIECKSGAGYGGDGGDGGDGGNGGLGGDGGQGGHIRIHYVEAPEDTNLETAAQFHTAGGLGGARGQGGAGGSGGEGGKAGSKDDPWCKAEPGRRGDPGANGDSGSQGSLGAAGAGGAAEFQQIGLEEWNAAFTKPYLVRANDASVGEQVVFETLNIDGPAMLHVMDEFTGDESDAPLTQLGPDRYGWTIPVTTTSTRFTVKIVRGQDDRESNTYRIEALPVIDGIYFADDFDAQPGGTAYLVGMGLNGASDVIYDGHRIPIDAATMFQDHVNPSGVLPNIYSPTDPPISRDVIKFTIPMLPTDDELFTRDGGAAEHTVHLDQPFPLADSDGAAVTLKRHYGLTFQPSINGFEFENSEMFETAEDYVTKDGVLGGLLGNNGFGGAAYRLFEDTYGAGEVDALGGLSSPLVWANYGLWYAYYAGDNLGTETGTGSCFGLSNLSLFDFFNDVTSELGKDPGDVVRPTVLLHGRQQSDEMLRLQLAQTLLDGIGPAGGGPSMTELTTRYLKEFYSRADQGDRRFAPTISFIPSFDAYAQTFSQALALIGETVIEWDNITPQESWDQLDAAYHELARAFKGSHTVTPYRVVYDDPSDSLPSRIYVYDSNRPGDDNAYLEIFRQDGKVTFNYPDEDFSSANGYMVSMSILDTALGNVDLLLDEDLVNLTAPGFNLPTTEALYDVVADLIGASEFLTPAMAGFAGTPTPQPSTGSEVTAAGGLDSIMLRATEDENVSTRVSSPIQFIRAESYTTEIITPPQHGSAAIDAATGELVYTPNAGYTGDDAFSYRIQYESGMSFEGEVQVTVAPKIRWQNLDLRWDVDNDDRVNIGDLLGVVQHLRAFGSSAILPEDPFESPRALVDVNGDGAASLADLLDVVRELRERQTAAAIDALATE